MSERYRAIMAKKKAARRVKQEAGAKEILIRVAERLAILDGLVRNPGVPQPDWAAVRAEAYRAVNALDQAARPLVAAVISPDGVRHPTR